MADRSILVTGGCGFVGINLAQALLASGRRVVLLDRNPLPAAAREFLGNVSGQCAVATADVRDTAAIGAVFREHRVGRVVHTAVITAKRDREAADPGGIVDVNVGGTINVLEAARAAGCERVVYAGSGAAYGATHDEGQVLREEISASRPQDVYGITKFAAEQIALRLGTLWDFDIACVRLGTVCGPWEFATGVRDMLSPYLHTARLAVRGEQAVLPREQPRRDWVYSRDVAEGLAAVALAGTLPGRVYHLSSGMEWNGAFHHWCETLASAYPAFKWRVAAPGERANVSFVVERDRSLMDVRRIAEDVGFRPRFGPQEAHADYLRWLRDHERFVMDAAKA